MTKTRVKTETVTLTRKRRADAQEIAQNLHNKGKTIRQISDKLSSMGYNGRLGKPLSYNCVYKWLSEYVAEHIDVESNHRPTQSQPEIFGKPPAIDAAKVGASSGHDAKKAALIGAVAHLDIAPELRLSMLESILSI